MSRHSGQGRLWREAFRAVSLGWDLALPVFLGVFVGYFLDGRLGTGHIFTLGLMMLGVFIGYANLGRFHRRLVDEERRLAREADSEE